MTVLPWSDSAPAEETRVIEERLLLLNARHVWTTNSQPAVDGARADHPAHGWGPSADGYVYQKAYLEFFLPTRLVPALLRLLRAPRYERRINYHVLDAAGTSTLTFPFAIPFARRLAIHIPMRRHRRASPLVSARALLPRC